MLVIRDEQDDEKQGGARCCGLGGSKMSGSREKEDAWGNREEQNSGEQGGARCWGVGIVQCWGAGRSKIVGTGGG